MAELFIEVKTGDGKSIRLDRKEAEEMYEMLAGIFAPPQPVFISCVPLPCLGGGPYEATCGVEYEEE